MTYRPTPYCNRHKDQQLVYDAKLGQRNAGPVIIVLPAGQYKMDLCPVCMGWLVDFVGDSPLSSHTGTVTGAEKLTYLPACDPEPLTWPSPTPPTFQS